MEVFAANGCNFLQFERKKISKQSSVLMPLNTCEASYLSDNLLSSSLNLSSCFPNECNSPHESLNRAVFTIQIPNFQILVVNSTACQLVKYSSDELCSMKLTNLIHDSCKKKLSNLYEKFIKSTGEPLQSNEKLLELVKKDGEIILVSIYLKKLDNHERCLALIKALDRKGGLIYVDGSGKILSCDENVGSIFQYEVSEIVGLNICILLPTVKILKGIDSCKILKQQITGRTKYGDAFPISLAITCGKPHSEEYQVVIWVLTGLNGLILLNRKLLITNFNAYFMKLLFGFSKKEILNMPILNLIPEFCKDFGLEQCEKHHPQSTNINNDRNSGHWSGENELNYNCSGYSVVNKCWNCSKTNSTFFLNGGSLKQCEWSSTSFHNNCDKAHEPKSFYVHKNAIPVCEKKGLARHRDGSYISIKYQVKVVALNDESYYCVWLSTDFLNILDLNKGCYPKKVSSFNSTSSDTLLRKNSLCSDQYTRPSSASLISQCDENLTDGDYSKYYTNIRQIGKGAFGFVKMAFRNSDGLLVVTKFTKKQSTNLLSWVFHSNLNMKIPLEISLLTTLHHPNIVKVLDVFHNDSYVQLVMEKHGAGFDLFEFINREPKCDEKLKSYIFRQITSAVHYLNSLGILHRDIKDENVIINEKFEIKLIDFGSATFMSHNETFSRFYGTVEYCSPEVLLGSSYKGPELEIWALGVTLYVLTFGENPFHKVEETIQGHFSIPFPITKELDNLLHHMLNKDVETRITIEEVVQHSWINQPVSIENYQFEEVVRCSKEEAYPPKFVYEIHSEEHFMKDSRTESNNSEDKIYPNGSLLSLVEKDDFDEISKCSLAESVDRKINMSSVMFSSTSLEWKSERLCKSATSVPSCIENSLSPSNQSSDYQMSSFVNDELFLINDYLSDVKFDSSSGESDSLEEDVPVFNNIYEPELQRNTEIWRMSTFTGECQHSHSCLVMSEIFGVHFNGSLLKEKSSHKNNSSQSELFKDIQEIYSKSGSGESSEVEDDINKKCFNPN